MAATTATATDNAEADGRAAPLTGPLAWLGDWRTVWVLTFAFVAVGFEAAINCRYVHDEGLLTWHFAGILGRAPIAGFFFQKLRPVLALVYAPVAPLGFMAFSIVHLLVGATAIPLTAALSRHFGHRLFAVPALVVASSPLMLVTAVAGHSNCDVAVGLLLGLYLLLVKGRSVLGGVVLGSLILVRSEIAPILLAIAVERLWARDIRVLWGMAVVPLAYALAGVPYHHDLLWIFHYPPTLMEPAPDTHWLERGALVEKLEGTVLAIASLSPATGLLLLLRPRALVRDERGLAVGLLLFLLMIRGFPLVGLFNFDTSPRYMLAGLPALALIIGRQSEDAREGRDGGWVSLLALVAVAAFGFFTASADDPGVLLPAVALWAAVMGLARLRRNNLALALWMLVTVASWPLGRVHTRLLPRRATLDELERWWVERGPDSDTEVLSNVKIAKAWLEYRDLLPHPEHFHALLQHDTAYELDALFDHEVGQDQALLEAMDEHFYGRPVLEERDPLDWPEGTVVIFENDGRLGDTIDVQRWRRHLKIEVERGDGRLLIGRVIHDADSGWAGIEPPAASEEGGQP
ncbi:MAG: hypothetical protein KC457_10395 [Myxococcales bacterium]|nr:hypothetical protein [Myxococcales bacterium]